MKKVLLVISLVVFLAGHGFVFIVNADQPIDTNPNGNGVGNGVPPAATAFALPTAIPDVDLTVLMGRLIDGGFIILLVCAALLIVVAGYFFLSAAGDPEKIRKAWHTVVYALVAVVVAYSARAIVGAITNVLLGNNPAGAVENNNPKKDPGKK